jgi:hypothetical protein
MKVLSSSPHRLQPLRRWKRDHLSCGWEKPIRIEIIDFFICSCQIFIYDEDLAKIIL